MDKRLDKMLDYIKKNKYYILVYIIFFIICILTPISGDDYGNYVKGQQGIFSIINHTKNFYLTWEGRVVSRIVILLFTYNKLFWNIITPLLFLLIFKSLLKNDSFKNKNSYLLLLISILAVNIYMFAQTYTWLAGNITYLYPAALVIYYFATLYKNIDNKLSVKQKVLLVILAIIIPMFTENIGCAFVFGNILFVIYLYYLKKKVKMNYLFLVLSIFSLTLMLISPGSASRVNSEGAFYLLSLFERIHLNMSYNLIQFTLTRHTTMLILMLICCNIYFVRKTKFKKIIKILLCILFDIIPVYTILQNLMGVIGVKSLILFSTYKLYYYPYWLLFGIVFFLSLISSYKDNKKLMLFYILLIVISLSSILCMLVVWPWGDRVSILFVIVLSFISLSIIDKNIKFNYTINYIIKLFFVLITVITIFAMFCTYKIDKYRIKYTIEQKEDNLKDIEVIYNPSPYVWLSNLNGEYFVNTYKEYQNLEKDTNLILKKIPLKEYIEIIFK